MPNVVKKGMSSPSSGRGVGASNHQQKRRQTISPLYNLTLRSLSESQPLMVRAPLMTRSRSEGAYRISQDGVGSCVMAQKRLSPDAMCNDQHNSGNYYNITGLHHSKEGTTGCNTALLTSPVRWIPCKVALQEKATKRRKGHDVDVVLSSSPRTLLRRSSSLLISPRPSPNTKSTAGVKGRKNMVAHSSMHSPLLTVQHRIGEGGKNSSNICNDERKRVGGMEHLVTEGLMYAEPPRHRPTSPSQHRLIYDNGDLLLQRQTSSSSAVSPMALKGADDGVEILLSPSVGDLQQTTVNSKMSSTSLQFSLPKDDEKSFSSESSFVAQVQTSSTDATQQYSTDTQMSFPRRSVSFHLLDNEGWASADGCKSFGRDRFAARSAKPRATSVPSCVVPLHPISRCSIRNSGRSWKSLDSPSSRLNTLGRNTIMEEFHHLQLKNDVFVLMDSEAKGRRNIKRAYVDGLRGILVEHIFRRRMFSSQGGNEKELTHTSSSFLSVGIGRSSPNPEAAERPLKKVKKTVKPFQPCKSRDNSLSPSLQKKPSCNRVVKFSDENDSGAGVVVDFPAYNDDSTSFPPTSQASLPRRLRKSGSISSENEVKRVEDLWKTMRRVEAQLGQLLSEEHRRRKRLISEEATAFHFLLRYQRIMTTAFQPTSIYVQEECQWQGVLTEATNALRLLQGMQKDLEHRTALIQFQQVALQLEDECRTCYRDLLQTEMHERQQLSWLFQMGLTALLELQASCWQRHEQQMRGKEEALVLEECREREIVCIEELRSRGLLYRTVECFSGALIELSVISPEGEECSCVTDYPMHLPLNPGVLTPNATVTSIVRSLNTSTAHHAAIINSSDRGAGAALLSPSGSSLSFERMFFEWNPTSNTGPCTTNTNTADMSNLDKNAFSSDSTKIMTNTGATTSTAVADASGEPDCVMRTFSSWRKTGVLQTPSPLPHEMRLVEATVCTPRSLAHRHTTSGDNTNTTPGSMPKGTVWMMCQPNSVQGSQLESSVDRSKSEQQNDAERPYELVDKDNGSSFCRPVRKIASRDVGVTANIYSSSSSPGKDGESQSTVFNRHIVPCSLKSYPRHKKKGVTTSVMQVSNSRLRRTVSRSTQLTPLTPRPYRDDIIFERAPQRLHPQSEKSVLAIMVEADTRSMPAPSTLCSSPEISVVSNSSGVRSVFLEVTETNERSGGSDNMEAVECMDGHMQSVVEVDEGGVADENSIEDISSTQHSTASLNFLEEVIPEGLNTSARKRVEASNYQHEQQQQQKEGIVVPDFSLSTMMDATVAGSVDGGNCGRGKGGWDEHVISGTAVAERENTVSPDSSHSANVSVSTGLNIESVGDCGANRYVAEDGVTPYPRLCRSSTVMEWTPSDCTCSNSENHHRFHCRSPSFNYMRPTMSWRRHHEELEWKTCISPSRRVSECKKAAGITTGSARKGPVKDSVSVQVMRFPFEEGPGVWGDAELRRRPFDYETHGSKAQEVAESTCQQSPCVQTLIYSPRRRQDVARRFMTEGSLSRCTSVPLRSVSRHSNANNTVPLTSTFEEKLLSDPAAMAAFHGLIEERTVSPSRTTVMKLSTRSWQRRPTPSYVDAFYRLGHETARRRCVLASLNRGSTLQLSAHRARTASTPHRRHSQHIQRRQEAAATGYSSHMVLPSAGVSHTC